jgi:hypothetical protein
MRIFHKIKVIYTIKINWFSSSLHQLNRDGVQNNFRSMNFQIYFTRLVKLSSDELLNTKSTVILRSKK